MSSVYGTIGLRREGRPSQPKCCKSIAETDILGAADGDRARNKLGIKLGSKFEVGMSRTLPAIYYIGKLSSFFWGLGGGVG